MLLILSLVVFASLAGILPGTAHALLYCAPEGTTKDNCVIEHDGTFYLFTMYRRERQRADIIDQWRHVWCATSTDGVHWKDVGPVIEDAPFSIWAMKVWKAGDRFIMDHGSFTDGKQDVLKFWESPDLIHWTYLGPDYDVRRPDGKRIDHMSVISQVENGKTIYYGYASASSRRMAKVNSRTSAPGRWTCSQFRVRQAALDSHVLYWVNLRRAGPVRQRRWGLFCAAGDEIDRDADEQVPLDARTGENSS